MQVTKFRLQIRGKHREFLPIDLFREKLYLPKDFSVSRFTPKNWEGLGMLDSSGDALAKVRKQVLASIPQKIALEYLVSEADTLTQVFRMFLISGNDEIGLRAPEIDYAVSGFHHLCQQIAFALYRLNVGEQRTFGEEKAEMDFESLYQAWLDEGTLVSDDVHIYTHEDLRFSCRVIYYPYGRAGLQVSFDGRIFYLLDKSLACPADLFIHKLLLAVSERFEKAVI